MSEDQRAIGREIFRKVVGRRSGARDPLMELTELVSSIETLSILGDTHGVVVTGISFDSRHVGPGDLFCAIAGEHYDGHLFIHDAVARGAVAVVVERFVPLPIVQVRVPPGSMRVQMAKLASRLYGNPSSRIPMVGITGTNGKTTTAFMLASIADAADHSSFVMGTLSGYRTTPESPVIQSSLHRAIEDHCDIAIMEVSSHALDQHRVDEIIYDIGIFTNLTQDHLDYHHTMEAYFMAKSRLFEAARCRIGIVNIDDPWGVRLIRDSLIAMETYSIDDAVDLHLGIDSSSFVLDGIPISLQIAGKHNVYNAMGAIKAAKRLGYSSEAIQKGLETFRGVPGRLERIDEGQPFKVFVDFAHTPVALEAALEAARVITPEGGRVIVVFGCGGDRDRRKRPLMGEVSESLADVTILTSDNPRSEDPTVIIQEILSGMTKRAMTVLGESSQVLVNPDRREAIEMALSMAKEGDVVVIAGKGHETHQTIGQKEIAFSDQEVSREILRRQRSSLQ
ncbi:MAG: UDP-N-acetylmuramoyl-L-alanyl-D-glutamate--2,6-diaminopimelate ligase [Actinomycetota bacterium]|nr:MAG: UDP-N-acetylmuramoyl-L-alanyl-D-glutamate--2,6-diaminopimelate ligase [Actinomycetota bacterium]